MSRNRYLHTRMGYSISNWFHKEFLISIIFLFIIVLKAMLRCKSYQSVMRFQLMTSMFIILLLNCAIVQGILNGRIAAADDFKYQIFLWNLIINEACGGSVIDRWHIITAGHCVYNRSADEYIVYAGTVSLVGSEADIRKVKEIYIHEEYKEHFDSHLEQRGNMQPTAVKNDIAVLRLLHLLPFGEHIEAISLPINDVDPCWQLLPCKVSGWGEISLDSHQTSDDLLWAKVMILGPLHCKVLQSPIDENELCTIDPQEESTILRGDSGGGLVCNGSLIGIISTTASDPYYPVTYTKVYSFLSFIDRITRANRTDGEPKRKKKKLENDPDETSNISKS